MLKMRSPCLVAFAQCRLERRSLMIGDVAAQPRCDTCKAVFDLAESGKSMRPNLAGCFWFCNMLFHNDVNIRAAKPERADPACALAGAVPASFPSESQYGWAGDPIRYDGLACGSAGWPGI